MSTQAEHDNHAWSRDTQKAATLVWISFLSACVMSLVFFAFVDPKQLLDSLYVEVPASREFGYAIGFFFFWAGCLSCGWLCLRLTRRKRQVARRIADGES